MGRGHDPYAGVNEHMGFPVKSLFLWHTCVAIGTCTGLRDLGRAVTAPWNPTLLHSTVCLASAQPCLLGYDFLEDSFKVYGKNVKVFGPLSLKKKNFHRLMHSTLYTKQRVSGSDNFLFQWP